MKNFILPLILLSMLCIISIHGFCTEDAEKIIEDAPIVESAHKIENTPKLEESPKLEGVFRIENTPKSECASTIENATKPPEPYHLYLTFDDGPLEGTEEVVNTIQEEQIRINVFVVGSHAPGNRRLQTYYRLYESNPCIEIGNHSYSHARAGYRRYYGDSVSVLNDFQKNEQTFQLKTKLARLPGRNMWRLKRMSLDDVKSGSSAADLLFKKGYTLFGWDLEWRHDAKTGSPIQTAEDIAFLVEKILKERRTVTENHLVILCHDEMFRKEWEEPEQSELKELIVRLRKTGLYEFNSLSEYPQ